MNSARLDDQHETHAAMKIFIILTGLIALCLMGCDQSVRITTNFSSSETVKARDITYNLPSSSVSSSSESADSFTYKGDSLTFTETHGKLAVNGKEFGLVKAGDTVAIDSAGAVSVNGTSRTAQ